MTCRLDEADRARVQVGTPVLVRVDAVPDRELPARIHEHRPDGPPRFLVVPAAAQLRHRHRARRRRSAPARRHERVRAHGDEPDPGCAPRSRGGGVPAGRSGDRLRGGGRRRRRRGRSRSCAAAAIRWPSSPVCARASGFRCEIWREAGNSEALVGRRTRARARGRRGGCRAGRASDPSARATSRPPRAAAGAVHVLVHAKGDLRAAALGAAHGAANRRPA